MNFWKRKSSYHICEVNRPFCEEIGSKMLKFEDLRSAPLKRLKRDIFKLRSFAHEVKMILCAYKFNVLLQSIQSMTILLQHS